MNRLQISVLALVLCITVSAAGAQASIFASDGTVLTTDKKISTDTAALTGDAPESGRAERRVHKGTNRTYLVWSLAKIQEAPVTASDMKLGGVTIGSDIATLLQAFGAPKQVHRGNMDTSYRFADADAIVRDAPKWSAEVTAQYEFNSSQIQNGVIAMATREKRQMTPRGLAVGNSRENVIRLYGKPSRVQFNPDNETTYYQYYNPERTQCLTAIVHGFQVTELRLELLTKPTREKDSVPSVLNLMGMSVGEVYHEPTWATWEQKAEIGTRCYWLFRDMIVEVDQSTQKIRKVILRSPHVATSAGIALGDSASTVLRAYGKPTLTEAGDINHPTVWYYTDDVISGRYLALVISADKKEVLDIILTDSKITSSPDRDVRYGIKS